MVYGDAYLTMIINNQTRFSPHNVLLVAHAYWMYLHNGTTHSLSKVPLQSPKPELCELRLDGPFSHAQSQLFTVYIPMLFVTHMV